MYPQKVKSKRQRLMIYTINYKDYDKVDLGDKYVNFDFIYVCL